MQRDEYNNELSRVLIGLLRGALQREDDEGLWQSLLELQAPARDYVAVLGLELFVDEAEGHAFLRQRASEEGQAELPRLVARRPLSFPVSLLLALLRKKLAELDAESGEARLILERNDIVELLRTFLPDTANEAKLVDRIDAHINKIVQLGFLRRLRGDDERLEVSRLLKAYVDAQWLSELERKLSEYKAHLAGEEVAS